MPEPIGDPLGPVERTFRGFEVIGFADINGTECSIQESSIATEHALWIGPNEGSPKILASQAAQHGVKTEQTTGWVEYPLPDEVLLTTRMHLSEDQVRGIVAVLQRWLETKGLSDREKVWAQR